MNDDAIIIRQITLVKLNLEKGLHNKNYPDKEMGECRMRPKWNCKIDSERSNKVKEEKVFRVILQRQSSTGTINIVITALNMLHTKTVRYNHNGEKMLRD